MFSRIKPSALILAAILIAVLSVVLPLLAQIPSSAAPQLRFRESDQTLPAGLWRLRLQGNTFTLEQNTAAAGNFSTLVTPISIAPTTGNITAIGSVLLPGGTAAAPAFSFSSDTDTGMYLVAANTLALATGGIERMRVTSTTFTVAGNLAIGLSANVPLGGSYSWTSGPGIGSTDDGIIRIFDSAGTGFLRLILGAANNTAPAISVSAAVAGQTQGVIFQRADGTPQVFANLGAATNGSMIYCSDCTIANPCAGSGTGAIAKRLNGVWVCN